MDQPADLLPPAPVRFWAILVRRSTIALRRSTAVVAWLCTDILPRLARRVAQPLPWPASATLRHLAVVIAKLLGGIVLLFAFILATAAPAYGLRLAVAADIWNLARYLEGPRQDVPADGLVLVMISILVLAALFSHRDDNGW
jgi:hypothetical protein